MLEPALGIGQQPQGAGEPAGGDRRRPCAGLLGGLFEHRRARLVAHARGAFDVMRTRGDRARALGECVGGERVRAQPPRLARGLIDGPAHDRMAKPVAARHRRRAQHVTRGQLLERRERLRVIQPGRGGGELEVGRIAHDRRPPGQPPRELAKAGDLLPERGRDRGRHADRAVARARDPGQLLHIERIAAALAEHLAPDRRGQLGAHQRVRLGGRQRRQAQFGDRGLARRRLERREHQRGQLPVAERERDQDPSRRGPPQQVHDQLQRGVVGPVDVVEHEHDGLLRREPPEQRAHRPMGPEALVLEPAVRHVPAGRRQHLRELAGAIADERRDAVGAERGDVVVERGHPDAERQLALELRAAPAQHEVLARPRASRQLGQQTRLAGAGLAAHHEPPRPR